MRKNILYKTLGLVLLMASLIGCENLRTAEQDVSPTVSPDDYPLVTFTTDFTGTTISEGDTITYTITIDKMIDRALTFTAMVVEAEGEKAAADVIDDHDFEAEPAVIATYSLETTLQIIFPVDDVPENAESATIEIGLENLGEKYLVHPDTENPVLDLSVANTNDPTAITIAFGWDTENDDIDLFAIHETNGDWGLAGTSANPEIMTDIWVGDPAGVYYVTIDPYHVEGSSFNYTVSIGYPDAASSVEFFSGTFNMGSLDTYVADYFAYWDVMTYRILEVDYDGDATWDVTHVLPQP